MLGIVVHSLLKCPFTLVAMFYEVSFIAACLIALTRQFDIVDFTWLPLTPLGRFSHYPLSSRCTRTASYTRAVTPVRAVYTTLHIRGTSGSRPFVLEFRLGE
jgi:hypothetical protein